MASNFARRSLIAVVVLAVLTLVASCGGTVPGSPTTSSSQLTKSPRQSAPHTSTNKANSLKNMNPCHLLGPNDVGNLGLSGPGEKDDITPVTDCDWEYRPDGRLGIALRVEGGLDTVTNDQGTPKEIEIPGRAALLKKVPSACFVFLAVSSNERVDVLGMQDAKPDCEKAKQAAEIISPKLPKA